MNKMARKLLLISWVITLSLFLLSGCNHLSKSESIPAKHPEELELARPDCTECHEDISTGTLKPYETFRHTGTFVKNHKQYARQSQALCSACHKPSFCQDCHAKKDELKPNVKMSDRPERMLPHRGDYIIQHRLDGRINPGKCFKCHGTKNNGICKRCHK